MPINKITATKRGKAAVAASLAAAIVGGWVAFFSPGTTTPAQIERAYVEQQMTPPAVEMAIDRLIKPYEGLRLVSYQDIVGVWTVCYGETVVDGKPVRAGMSFTPQQCESMLKKRVFYDYYLPLAKRVKGFLTAPDSVQASMISGAYNFGTEGQIRSTAARLVTQGKFRQACEAQTAWNRAGGKVVNGLVIRREMGDAQRLGEAELCVSGLPNVQ
ncbi:lysozyme [Allorhizobium taibaishanense]|uniref:Lysozyme n=1 Tax=Allorhizobium taibaishanense TaxID=887144 RepID=A0A1Q9A2Q1_9HYPH|nr:lysozyme [Allorhizobium taibaishanense]MBB4005790.1 GH24 family phage-related lysozyme (muramidase) [Allorhizobium taibaishanense]OLP48839.1 glycoside hydrolase [Allorhizobium taibaishanense]